MAKNRLQFIKWLFTFLLVSEVCLRLLADVTMGAFHTDVNPLAKVVSVFKFVLAPQVGFLLPPHTAVRVERSVDARGS